MTVLYNNTKQTQKFGLKEPHRASFKECRPIKAFFKSFNCTNAFILVESTRSFNCIGWAVGVKDFLDPVKHLNIHYTAKQSVGDLVSKDVKGNIKATYSLYNYTQDTEVCKSAAIKFFDAQKSNTVLPDTNYKAVDSIQDKPLDNTIAFYFKGCVEVLDPSHGIQYCGFQHAARFIKDVDQWVSDIWTSKLGPHQLITHQQDELKEYGDILCYLEPVGKQLVADDSSGDL